MSSYVLNKKTVFLLFLSAGLCTQQLWEGQPNNLLVGLVWLTADKGLGPLCPHNQKCLTHTNRNHGRYELWLGLLSTGYITRII